MPARTPYSKGFGELYSEARLSKKDPFKPSRYYLAVGDLRPFGYDSILHAHCVHGDGNFKLELIDTGKSSLANLVREIERVFEVDGRRMEVSRLDLAADIRDVPVSWFMDHLRAKHKRWAADFGNVDYSRMGMNSVETLYLGKRPNFYRIYDKIAEFRYQYARLRPDGDLPKPSFEELYGYPEAGVILTRVERQIGGGRLPATIGTVGKLASLPDFYPFDQLEILAGASEIPNADHYELSAYLQGVGLKAMVAKLGGIQRTIRWINRHSPGNAARLLKRYAAFLPASAYPVTVERIHQAYRESVQRQMAA